MTSDFSVAQYFEHIEEMEWAIEVAKETNKPVAASMCIGVDGDLHGISTGECAVRMAKAGACAIDNHMILPIQNKHTQLPNKTSVYNCTCT